MIEIKDVYYGMEQNVLKAIENLQRENNMLRESVVYNSAYDHISQYAVEQEKILTDYELKTVLQNGLDYKFDLAETNLKISSNDKLINKYNYLLTIIDDAQDVR